jgi:hypothetical protein
MGEADADVRVRHFSARTVGRNVNAQSSSLDTSRRAEPVVALPEFRMQNYLSERPVAVHPP